MSSEMPSKETAKTGSARKNYIPKLLLAAAIGFLFVVIYLWISVSLKEAERVVGIGRESFSVEVADTKGEREKGLSERDSLAKNSGMLFDFKDDGTWKIWMLKMKFPLDIAWLDEKGKIVYLRTNVAVETFPEVFAPDKKARYVLEVNAGTFQQTGVKTGDMIRL